MHSLIVTRAKLPSWWAYAFTRMHICIVGLELRPLVRKFHVYDYFSFHFLPSPDEVFSFISTLDGQKRILHSALRHCKVHIGRDTQRAFQNLSISVALLMLALSHSMPRAQNSPVFKRLKRDHGHLDFASVGIPRMVRRPSI